MIYLKVILAAAIGYLLGCIPMGVMISRFYANTDIRKTGSGNTGTTNVLRTLGWVPSVLTLAGDCLKGVLGALVGRYVGGEAGMLLGGLCAVLGHDFPVFMHFKGGKGIATSLGVTIIIAPKVAPWLVVIVIAIVALIRLMSVGSLTASISYPILFWFLMPASANRTWTMVFAVVMAILSFYCHRANIMRLIRGEENRLDFGKINKISKKFMQMRREKSANKN